MALGFPGAYALTLALEVPVVFLFLHGEKKLRAIPLWKILLGGALASTITLPFVWFVFPLIPLPYAAWLGLAEAFAFGAEAVFYALFFKISWKKAALMSLCANLISFLAGLALNHLV